MTQDQNGRKKKGQEKRQGPGQTGPLLGNIKDLVLIFKESLKGFDQAMGHNNFCQLDLKDH